MGVYDQGMLGLTVQVHAHANLNCVVLFSDARTETRAGQTSAI